MKRLTRTKRALLGAGASLALIGTLAACVPVPNVPLAAPGVCNEVKPLVSDNAQFITRCSGYGPLRWDTANNTGVPLAGVTRDAAMSGDGSTVFDFRGGLGGSMLLVKMTPGVAVEKQEQVVAQLPDSFYWISPNQTGSRVLMSYYGSNDTQASVVVDLTTTPAKVIPLTALIGKQSKTATPFSASIDGDRVNTLIVDSKYPTVAKFHTYNLASGAQTDGTLPLACPIYGLSLTGSTAFCNAPSVQVTTYNLITGVKRTLATATPVAVASSGDRAVGTIGTSEVWLDNGQPMLSGDLTVFKADGTQTTIDRGVDLGFGLRTSTSGTAVVYRKVAMDGSATYFTVSF